MIGPAGFQAAPKAAEEERPTCAVRGMIQRGAMCSQIIVGLKYCGYSGECEHKCLPPSDITKDAP